MRSLTCRCSGAWSLHDRRVHTARVGQWLTSASLGAGHPEPGAPVGWVLTGSGTCADNAGCPVGGMPWSRSSVNEIANGGIPAHDREICPEPLRPVESDTRLAFTWPVSAEVSDPLAQDPAYRPTPSWSGLALLLRVGKSADDVEYSSALSLLAQGIDVRDSNSCRFRKLRQPWPVGNPLPRWSPLGSDSRQGKVLHAKPHGAYGR